MLEDRLAALRADRDEADWQSHKLRQPGDVALRSLGELRLYGNLLTGLPDSIGRLARLRELQKTLRVAYHLILIRKVPPAAARSYP